MIKIKSRLADSRGFTMLELIVVLAIMAFLVAMIAPRMAYLADSSRSTVNDTNIQRMSEVVSATIVSHNALPNGLTNLVNQVGTGFVRPDKALAPNFIGHNQLATYMIDAQEAAEMNNLGVTEVHNLNYQDGVTTGRTMAVTTVGSGLAVLAIGAGVANGTDRIDLEDTTGIAYNNPEYIGRFVLGVGPGCDLVQWKNLDSAGLCPSNMSQSVPFQNYCIVVPRLQSTVNRYPSGFTRIDVAASDDGATEATKGEQKTLWVKEPTSGFPQPQMLGSFSQIDTASNNATVCVISPDGSKWPREDGANFWIITTP